MQLKLRSTGLCPLAVATTLMASTGFAAPDTPAPATTPSAASWELDVVKAMELSEKFAFSSRMAESNVEANVAKSRQTLASMGPSVSLESTQAWISKDVNKMVGQSTGAGTVPSRVNTASITVAQPIIPLGPLYLKLQADLTAVEVSRLEAKQSRRNARFSGAESYIKALKAEQFLTIADASLKLGEKQRADGEALFRAGKLTNVDLLRLDMALADAKAQQAQAKNLRELAFVGLAETVGAPDYRALKLKTDKSTLYESQPVKVENREALVNSALQNRAEVRAVSAGIETANYYSLAANLDYLPMINAFLKYERDFEAKDLTIPGRPPTVYKKEDIRDKLTYGINLKWTLWDWGSRWFKSDEMAATVQKSRLAKEQVESGIRIEATQAILDLDYALASLETSKTAVKVSEEAYKQQNVRFQSGSMTVTDIITAERDLTRARGGLINAQGDLDLAWLKFFRVTAQDPQSLKPNP